tara:strand:- start:556 stop:1209 length:654 start_codon:yes stop_codon:yes gene_type:complete
MENWKRFINESEEKNYKGPPLNYSSVVLNKPQVLIDKVMELKQKKEWTVPDDFKENLPRYPHHMTISMGGLFGEWVDGDDFTLTIDAWGFVNKGDVQAMAFRVDLPDGKSTKNNVPHITTLVGPSGKPVNSNEIDTWNEITPPFKVKGVVVAKQQAKKKPKPPKPPRNQQKGQTPVEFAKGLSSRRLPVDKIKDIIMKKFKKPEQDALDIMKDAGIS